MLDRATNARALAVAAHYFPPDRLPLRSRLFLEELFDKRD